MTVGDFCVTRRTKSAIMEHSMCKSTQFAPRIVPGQSETSAHIVQEGSTAFSRSHFVQNVALCNSHEVVM